MVVEARYMLMHLFLFFELFFRQNILCSTECVSHVNEQASFVNKVHY